ncbi:protein FAR1-RELATED SEQUENCE 2 [Morus notabilis]|uniref:protein FAR1-RELATED SEQUENCE 2 n=1 Tax=Morus notabilis TaxID=981085 RepID=UPI000CED4057|nr:protein FAR1-RELATED SEQUENCE 2 [Morus notabilis]
MEIDLEQPSCEQEKLDVGSNSNADVVDETDEVHVEEEHANSRVFSECCGKEDDESNADEIISSGRDQVDVNVVGLDVVNEGSIREPCNGLEFESKEEAYSFYREYARSVGFGITIKASRRSKKSGKFIDIKIACSRFGSKRESGTAVNPRPCIKTDCKAGMHMKRKDDGKWVIHSFVKEHNHNIYPDDFLYAMCRKKKDPTKVACEKKGLQVALDDGDIQLMLEFFMHMQEENHNFFYSIDLDHKKGLKNVLWVDAKGRHEYINFCDVVFFDTFYLTKKYKIPFLPIAGVNHHFQYILLGCALIGEETTSTFVWLMRTWLKAVGGQAPRVIITDQEKALKEAVVDVFPDARHCFCLWHVLRRIPENLGCAVVEKQNFMEKFNKSIRRSWTDEQFERRWQKLVDGFDLKEDEGVQSLYEDRKSWAPAYMEDVFLAGMSTTERAESITAFLDRYICPETTFKEFVELHRKILEDLYNMEANADFESRHQQQGLRSLLSFEKQMSPVYTEVIFKQFQVEVSGVVSCHLQKDSENEATVVFRVDDSKEHQSFVVAWNAEELQIRCLCRSFEYRGFLCRHALLVFQMSGVSCIPSHYILKRWTKDAKVGQTVTDIPQRHNFRLQRFHDLCKFATKLGEAGSLSLETYHTAFRTLEEALKNCVDVNNSVRDILGSNISTVDGHIDVEHNHGAIKASKKKKTYKKRKVQSELEGVTMRIQDSVPQMNTRADDLDSGYIPQQDMQRGELDSRAQALDGYYIAPHGIQGVLNSISPIRGSYYTQGMQLHSVPTRVVHYGNQQNMQGLLQGHVGFKVPTAHGCFDLEGNLQNMEQSVASSQYHSIASKHLQVKHLSR